MGIFRRRREPELATAKRIRDLQFAEVDLVVERARKSVKLIEDYALAERRRIARGKVA